MQYANKRHNFFRNVLSIYYGSAWPIKLEALIRYYPPIYLLSALVYLSSNIWQDSKYRRVF